MSILTSKIEKFVPDHTAIMVRAKVMGSRFKPAGPQLESGVVTFKVVDLYRGAVPVAGSIFEIEGSRGTDPERRLMDDANSWNSLPFAMNDELLLALHPTGNPRVFVALAAITSLHHGADLKEAVAIEALPIAQRLARIQLALQSESELLQGYALAALRAPGVATREQGALALTHAFEATRVESVRLTLFSEIETRPYADLSHGADLANRAIVATMLKAILQESNAERRAGFLNHFAALVGSKLSEDSGKDRDLRAKLAGSIQDPPKAQVLTLLKAAEAAAPADLRFKRLVEAWAH